MKKLLGNNLLAIKEHLVHGVKINLHTGCSHYDSTQDIVAIKFKCCNAYYACYFCHQALTSHPVQTWKSFEFQNRAILCGRCGCEMTIHEYLQGSYNCIHCKAPFNPNCKFHHFLYFEVENFQRSGKVILPL